MWQVIGQPRAVELLRNSLETGRLVHAYLFIGPAHIGKMTLAINLAQALNCESDERPCLECGSCRKIASSGHADVRIIGLARNEDDTEAKLIGIDQIKDIQHSANLPPFEGKAKVFIIDNADLMSNEAANCLLKILEEPADKVTFILLTTSDGLLLPTVVSRCQRLELPPLSIIDEAGELAESTGMEADRARLLAGLSHGRPGWAIAAAGDEGLLLQRREGLDRLLEFIETDIEERFAFVGQLAGRFNQDRSVVYDMLDLWLDYWRDLMLVKLGRNEMITNIDRHDELVGLSGCYGLSGIRNFIKSIWSTVDYLRKNVNPRLALEELALEVPAKEGGAEEVPAKRVSVEYG